MSIPVKYPSFSVKNDQNFNVAKVSTALSAPSLEKVLASDDFTTYSVGNPIDNWVYFQSGAFTGNDATALAQNNELKLNPTPQAFTLTVPQGTDGGLDHVKYLVYRKGAFTAPDDGNELVYEAEIAVNQTFAAPPQVPVALQAGVQNMNDDIRLCSGAINCIDYDTMMVFDCFMSNNIIYAFYERLPFLEPNWFTAPNPINNTYHAFSHCIPIARRATGVETSTGQNPINDFVKVAIAYNRSRGYVRWLVNGVERYRVNRIGCALDAKYRVLDHGGPDVQVDVRQLNFGFGLFTLLDMSLPNVENYIDTGTLTATPNNGLVQIGAQAGGPVGANCQYVNHHGSNTTFTGLIYSPPTFIDGSSLLANRIFGQGAQMTIRNWKVYVFDPTVQQDPPVELTGF